ncbi:hypothetical protein ROLI_025310 [Roseobacter fucihabitans]|uniref:Histidinol phosphate aminotransferase n=1 Tax=Roseobacter fucihabitans TaxID=1537242 RepID=A0ABZ2BW93_9RHOB|nr:hypothetical protein [Roseobacter litoralis]MBC6967987.1 hypothetical protein [Roseobacter litoralis]
MDNHKLGRAPNYTTACIVMFGVNLTLMLLFLFALWGLVVAAFVALAVNHWLNWLEERRRREDARWATPTSR